MQKPKFYHTLLTAFLLVSSISMAGERSSNARAGSGGGGPGSTSSGGAYPTAIFRLQQNNYSGLRNKSFGESNPGFSGGVAVLMQREFFVPYVGLSIGGHLGKQSFFDGPTEFLSSYNFQYGSAEGGLFFFPIGRKDKGLNVYINLGGLVSYNSISLKTNDTLTTLTSKSEQVFSSGYKGNVGFEWILKNRGSRAKWTVYAEVGFKKESAQMLKQSFVLDSLSYSVGLGW